MKGQGVLLEIVGMLDGAKNTYWLGKIPCFRRTKRAYRTWASKPGPKHTMIDQTNDLISSDESLRLRCMSDVARHRLD